MARLAAQLRWILGSRNRRPSSVSPTSAQAPQLWEAGQPTRGHHELVGIQYVRALAAIAVLITTRPGRWASQNISGSRFFKMY